MAIHVLDKNRVPLPFHTPAYMDLQLSSSSFLKALTIGTKPVHRRMDWTRNYQAGSLHSRAIASGDHHVYGRVQSLLHRSIIDIIQEELSFGLHYVTANMEIGIVQAIFREPRR